MADVEINLARDGGSLSNSPVTIGDIAGGNISKTNTAPPPIHDELSQRVQDLERFVFGDARLGIVGIHQQLQGLRFWIIFNTCLSLVLIIYEVIRTATA